MKTLRNSIAVTLLTVLALALFGLAYSGFSASAQAKDNKVTYNKVETGDYNFDPAHGVIGFGVKHLEIAIVEGRFKDFKGTVSYDANDITKSSVEFSAKIDSIDTGVDARNAHLRTADFFDAAKFPEMKFKSTRVQKKGKGYLLTGDLTIKGITKQVTLPFTMTGAVSDPWGGTRFGINAATTIDRRDFGITWGHAFAGGFDVANEVAIELHLEAAKATPKSAK